MKKEKIEVPANFPLPLNKSVWVLEEKAHESKTKSGIIIPESVVTGAMGEGASGVGVVYAIGPLVDIQVQGTRKIADGSIVDEVRPLQVGDKVMYNLYENRGISVGGYFYIQMHESALQSVLPDEETIVLKGERIDRRRAAVAKKQSEVGGKGSNELIN